MNQADFQKLKCLAACVVIDEHCVIKYTLSQNAALETKINLWCERCIRPFMKTF